MSNIKPKRIVIHGCYSVKNSDLGIRDKNGNLMKGEHDVFVIRKAKRKGYYIVKTITSLENTSTNSFHNSALNDVKNGVIIPIPNSLINSKRLSGINRRAIRIHKSKLFKANRKFKYPLIYNYIITKNVK